MVCFKYFGFGVMVGKVVVDYCGIYYGNFVDWEFGVYW